MTARRSAFFWAASVASARIASSFGTGFESTWVVPSAASTTLKTTWMSLRPLEALGRSRGTFDWDTMILAVTMKMMSKTNMISTSGVTLIPLIASSES